MSQLLDTSPPQVKVIDYNREETVGSFYLQEIQVVDKPKIYRIERIIKQRTRKGKKEYLVKWIGYPDHFNGWVGQDKIEHV